MHLFFVVKVFKVYYYDYDHDYEYEEYQMPEDEYNHTLMEKFNELLTEEEKSEQEEIKDHAQRFSLKDENIKHNIYEIFFSADLIDL